MTHDCCLMPDWQGCVVLADSNPDTPQSFTCHWPSILAIVLSWNPPTQLPYHMSMSHIANRLHDDRQIWWLWNVWVISTDCWCSLWTAQVLLSCPHNVLETVTPVQILTSITDLWGAHHKQGCQGPGQTGHTGHYAMCWAGPVAAGRLCTFHNMLCSPALQ